MNAKPISEPAKTGAGCFVVFGLVFFLVGVFVIATSVVMPFLSAEAASDWRQIPCQILSSDVDVRRGDEKNTYLVDIEYEYDVGNQTYQSSLFEFNNFSRSRKECAAIV